MPTRYLLGFGRQRSRKADVGLRFVHTAVGGRRRRILTNATPVEQPGGAVITLTCVHLHGAETTDDATPADLSWRSGRGTPPFAIDST